MTPTRSTRTRRGAVTAFSLSVALLVGTALGASPATADPAMDAAAQARALSQKIENLQTDAAVATEKFNAVSTHLADVVAEMLTVTERVDALNRENADGRANATRRISAIYKAGGGLTLYATVLDGSSPDDMVSRIRTVQSLVDDDYDQNTALQTEVREATDAKAKMRALARERTDLERTAREGKERIDGLIEEAAEALASANATVARLAKEDQARREAAAEAQAQSTLSTFTLTTTAAGNPYAAAAMSYAASKIGLPYVWGGNGPNGYDCSGLLQQAYKAAGLSIMRVAADQFRQATRVPMDQIAPGDFVAWSKNPANESAIHHIAMYVGDGKMIEAPRTGLNIRLVPLRTGPQFVGAARPGLPAGGR